MTYSTNFNAFFPLTKNFTLEMTNPDYYCTIYFYSQPLIERYSISKYIFNLNQQTVIPSLTASLVTKGFFFGRLIPRTCNINEIKEGKTIMDFFEKPFPYAFYLKIGKEKQYTNIFFKMSDYKYTQQSSNDNFIVKAYQVERETIDQYINDNNIEIKGKEIEVGYITSNTTYTIQYQDNMMNYGYYIFVTIKQTEDNFNEYSYVAFTYNTFYLANHKYVNQYVYNYGSFTGGVETFKLETTDYYKYIDCDIGFKPLEKGKAFTSFDFAVEHYKDVPTLKNSTDIEIVSMKNENGKIRIKFLNKISNNNIILSIMLQISEDISVDYMIKYTIYQYNSSFPTLNYNSTISGTRRGRKFSVTFRETNAISPNNYAKSVSYYLTVYKIKNFSSINDVDTIYHDCPDVSIMHENITFSSWVKGKEHTLYFALPYEEYDVYINIVGLFVFSRDSLEVLFSYTPSILVELPKLFTVLDPNIYNKQTVNNTQTFLLEKDKVENSFFIIDIATEPSITKEYFDFALEEYWEIQTYKNESTLKLVDYQDISGKKTLIIEFKSNCERDIVISLLSQKEINYMLKYHTVDDLSKIPPYQFNSSISALRRTRKVEVTFDEQFNKDPLISTTNYYIYLYNTSIITDINQVHSIYHPSIYAQATYIINGKNEGQKINYTITLPNSNYDLWINVVSQFTVKNTNEQFLFANKLVQVLEKPKIFELLKKKIINYQLLDKSPISFRLEHQDTNDNIFKIEIGYEATKDNCYIELSYEKYFEYPSYKNDTTYLELIEEKSNRGKTSIILKLRAELENDFIISFRLLSDSPVHFYIKYNTFTTENIPEYKTDQPIKFKRTDGYLHVEFSEVLTNKEIAETALYRIQIFKHSEVNEPANIYTSYPNSSLTFTETNITSYNEGQSIKETIYLAYDFEEDITINIICYFIDKEGEYFLVPYQSVNTIFYESLPPKKWNYKTWNPSETKTLRLKRQFLDSSYYKIEIAPEQRKDYSFIPLAVEQYVAIPTYRNGTFDELNIKYSEGKEVIVVKYPKATRDLIISFISKGSNNDQINYMIKYQNVKTLESTYEFNNTIDVHLNKEYFEVVFSTIVFREHIDSCVYLLRAYYMNEISDINLINTIYPSSALAFYSKNITVIINSTSFTYSFPIPAEKYQIYFSIVGIINDEFIGYSIGKNEDYPFTKPKEKSYNHYTMSDINQIDTYLLINEDNSDLFEIEYYGDISNYSLQYSIEAFTFYPTYKNGTQLSITSSKLNHTGKNVIYIKSSTGPLTQLLIHFFIKNKNLQSNALSSEEKLLTYSFKYKTINNTAKDEYKYESDYGVNILNSIISIDFKELFEDSSKVKESKYIIGIYEKDSISNINELNTIDIETLGYKAITNRAIITENKGKIYYYSVPLVGNEEYYVTLIGLFTMNSNEKIIINYGIKSPHNYNLLYLYNYCIIGVCCVLLIIGLICFAFSKKKQKEIDLSDIKLIDFN